MIQPNAVCLSSSSSSFIFCVSCKNFSFGAAQLCVCWQKQRLNAPSIEQCIESHSMYVLNNFQPFVFSNKYFYQFRHHRDLMILNKLKSNFCPYTRNGHFHSGKREREENYMLKSECFSLNRRARVISSFSIFISAKK